MGHEVLPGLSQSPAPEQLLDLGKVEFEIVPDRN